MPWLRQRTNSGLVEGDSKVEVGFICLSGFEITNFWFLVDMKNAIILTTKMQTSRVCDSLLKIKIITFDFEIDHRIRTACQIFYAFITSEWNSIRKDLFEILN